MLREYKHIIVRNERHNVSCSVRPGPEDRLSATQVRRLRVLLCGDPTCDCGTVDMPGLTLKIYADGTGRLRGRYAC